MSRKTLLQGDGAEYNSKLNSMLTELYTALDGAISGTTAVALGGNLTVAGTAVITGNIGFYGHAAAAKPTVSGSRGSNAALASLLTGLAGLGLLTDSSS